MVSSGLLSRPRPRPHPFPPSPSPCPPDIHPSLLFHPSSLHTLTLKAVPTSRGPHPQSLPNPGPQRRGQGHTAQQPPACEIQGCVSRCDGDEALHLSTGSPRESQTLKKQHGLISHWDFHTLKAGLLGTGANRQTLSTQSDRIWSYL